MYRTARPKLDLRARAKPEFYEESRRTFLFRAKSLRSHVLLCTPRSPGESQFRVLSPIKTKIAKEFDRKVDTTINLNVLITRAVINREKWMVSVAWYPWLRLL